ncbi:hypothetical protein KVR01_008418 [Diaporthe batatas]|uniref:uncharacterized protein n=1 Tax=Diaporthe batatas TaxID=748121 RepID=UPI001D052E9D|nr:uncharacterized protein KVR01_008418 [Diaporthe batatas]KAG8161431.1 hypothetical protein KVR01_008418 [Diaporthe batatas]
MVPFFFSGFLLLQQTSFANCHSHLGIGKSPPTRTAVVSCTGGTCNFLHILHLSPCFPGRPNQPKSRKATCLMHSGVWRTSSLDTSHCKEWSSQGSTPHTHLVQGQCDRPLAVSKPWVHIQGPRF